jgi:hypothetical protein
VVFVAAKAAMRTGTNEPTPPAKATDKSGISSMVKGGEDELRRALEEAEATNAELLLNAQR